MVFALVGMVSMLWLLDESLRKRRIALVVTRNQYRLFAIRDTLRFEAICQDATEYRWFRYMDTTITKTIELLEDINLWTLIRLLSLNRNDTEMKKRSMQRNKDFKRSENAWLQRSLDAYGAVIADHLRQRHVLVFGVVRALIAMQVFKKKLFALKNRAVDAISSSPATSTLMTYATS